MVLILPVKTLRPCHNVIDTSKLSVIIDTIQIIFSLHFKEAVSQIFDTLGFDEVSWHWLPSTNDTSDFFLA